MQPFEMSWRHVLTPKSWTFEHFLVPHSKMKGVKILLLGPNAIILGNLRNENKEILFNSIFMLNWRCMGRIWAWNFTSMQFPNSFVWSFRISCIFLLIIFTWNVNLWLDPTVNSQVFWFGDLNYRINMLDVEVRKLVDLRRWDELLNNDQVRLTIL